MKNSQRTRVRIALFSVGAGVIILLLKFLAFSISGSTALKSDAIESVVNVIAALFAVGAVIVAEQPADREHPYGHGKIESFSAAFEGGLISLASVAIMYEAIHAFFVGPDIKDLSTGLLVNLGTGVLNGLLGWFLVRSGKKHGSQALIADGHHVLSDFFTTLGIGFAVFLVWLTGIIWLDSVLAFGVGLWLAYTGYRIVRTSLGALMDAEDPEILKRLIDAISRLKPVDVITVHDMKTLRAGRYTHVDVHVVVPEFYEISRAHDLVESFGRFILTETTIEGEFHSHVDPCRQSYCTACRVSPCPVRQSPFAEPLEITPETATLSDQEEAIRVSKRTSLA